MDHLADIELRFLPVDQPRKEMKSIAQELHFAEVLFVSWRRPREPPIFTSFRLFQLIGSEGYRQIWYNETISREIQV